MKHYNKNAHRQGWKTVVYSMFETDVKTPIVKSPIIDNGF